MDSIVGLISNVGFPIACCVVLFVQQNKLSQTLNELAITLNGINQRLDNIEDNVK